MVSRNEGEAVSHLLDVLIASPPRGSRTEVLPQAEVMLEAELRRLNGGAGPAFVQDRGNAFEVVWGGCVVVPRRVPAAWRGKPVVSSQEGIASRRRPPGAAPREMFWALVDELAETELPHHVVPDMLAVTAPRSSVSKIRRQARVILRRMGRPSEFSFVEGDPSDSGSWWIHVTNLPPQPGEEVLR